ncbi:hypothetical protein [Legionella londiniensis]|uniref:Uncharacterized protein n=1 Tax=Legionella londiniensis TaxID=45068 RepID=A0A0W0VNK3_9GAMM|nr:hypothetical protein [Legionella londiniensis]KTD21662.1 hypothetical protein Llon_0827 [Legionella londiniensis]STX93503.1 Uncharacterised protein [Legionella londiniensis]
MDEYGLLLYFYEDMEVRGLAHNQVFLSIDDDMLRSLREKYGDDLSLRQVEKLADICIANEWLERTTADQHYNFLSLTEKGLNVVLKHKYSL